MSLKTNSLNIATLINFTKDGIVVASYQEVRSVIVATFKRIYGEDIDLSSASADGVYVETLSLMISNMLQSFKQFYSQLDVNTATGAFLDNLCALSNVRRKPATNSTCSITLTLSDTETQPYTTTSVTLVDKNGNTWSYTSNQDTTFNPGEPVALVFTCDKSGPVSAKVGWIDKTVSTEKVFTIQQNEDAILGSYSESDSSLRARRNASLGATGSTVLETIIGTLYNLGPILDVKIYNNDTDAEITALDGTKVAMHDVYVVLRRQQNVDIADSKIGSAIYEKLTPGIKTTKSNGQHGVAKMFVYKQSSTGTPIESEITQNVYWKEAKPVKQKIVITLNVTTNYGSKNNSTSNLIANRVIQYLNNLSISSSVNINSIWNVVTCSDPKFRGQSTFSIESITLDGAQNNIYVLPDTYFDYTINDISVNDPNNSSSPSGDLSKVVITIGE